MYNYKDSSLVYLKSSKGLISIPYFFIYSCVRTSTIKIDILPLAADMRIYGKNFFLLQPCSKLLEATFSSDAVFNHFPFDVSQYKPLSCFRSSRICFYALKSRIGNLFLIVR